MMAGGQGFVIVPCEELTRLLTPLCPDHGRGRQDERSATVAYGQFQSHEGLTCSRRCKQVKRGAVVRVKPVKEVLLVVA